MRNSVYRPTTPVLKNQSACYICRMAAEPSILSRLLNWNKNSTPETVDAEQYAEAFDKFKALLLEQYQLRLQTKTAKRLPINLSAKSTDFGMDPDRARAFLPTQTIESQDIAKEIDKILHTHDRLLIIGDPGAGKTTILLFAAINILMDKSREQKLPLIINLATWQTGRDFKEWYAQSIAHTYSLSLIFAEELLRRNVVVPFFDGFDEVAEDAREECLQQMSAYFGDQRSRQLIVSSRKKEYAAVKADAPVYAEFEVQPLTLSQIKKALSENAQTQAADRALLDAIERDAHLAKAVETPFYLNTASFLFGKGQRTWGDFPFRAESSEGRQEELVEIFVGEQVPDLKDRKYLGFLAGKMEEENFLVFELVRAQPKWCGQKWRYKVAIGFLPGFIVYCFFSEISFILGIVIGLIYGGLSSLVLGSFYPNNIGNQVFRWKTLFNFIKKKALLDNILGILTLSSTVIVGLIKKEPGFLTLGVMTIMFFIRIFGSSNYYLLYLFQPYQRFKERLRGLQWLWFAILLTCILQSFFSLFFHEKIPFYQLLMLDDLSWAYVIFRLLTLLMIMFILSWGYQHFVLRLVLYLENKLPLRLVTFLDRMTDQYIFEDNRRTFKGKKQRGATWRFRHKILQDYFAGLGVDSSLGSKR